MTCPVYNDLNGHPIYFDQSPSSGKATHAFYNYFSENFAIPNESISFSLCEIEQQTQQLYFLIFKIRFSDTLGREYEQEFKFGYDNYLVKGINPNSISNPPKLIKDINLFYSFLYSFSITTPLKYRNILKVHYKKYEFLILLFCYFYFKFCSYFRM